jgi:hypothetical protein
MKSFGSQSFKKGQGLARFAQPHFVSLFFDQPKHNEFQTNQKDPPTQKKDTEDPF